MPRKPILLSIVFFTTFFGSLGISSIFPLLPSLQIEFNIDGIQVGNLVVILSISGVIGAIYFGLLSDRLGRKPVLIVTTLLSGLVYLLTAYTDSYHGMIFARAVTGFLSGSFAVCFAVASDLSDKETRFKYMGLMGLSFALGFTLGPVLSGILSVVVDPLTGMNIRLPFVVVAVCHAFLGIFVIFVLPESLPKHLRAKFGYTEILRQIKEIFSNIQILIMNGLSIFLGALLSGFMVYLSLFMSDQFAFQVWQIGVYWTVFSLISSASQVLVTYLMLPKKALFSGIGLITVSLIILLMADNNKVEFFFVATIFLASGMGALLPSIITGLALEGSANQQGMIFAFSQSLRSLGRALGPYLFGMLFVINANLLWLVLVIVLLLILIILLKYRSSLFL